MYKKEIEHFNKKIIEERISRSAERALRDVVDEFFSVNYENISEKRKREVELNFELRHIVSKLRYYRSDVDGAEKIFSQIKNCLFTMLDKSVDRSKSNKGSINEKISESVMLQPNFHGVGIDLKKLLKK